MNRRGGVFPLIATAIIVIVLLVLFFFADFGLRTAPVERTGEQNSGTNAPAETVPSPGTGKAPNGNAELPAGQQ
jgi:hypothetical protein